MHRITEHIRKNGYLLFDGAMGTVFSALPGKEGMRPEEANLSDPEIIADVHWAYLTAGAAAIKTNTFSLGQLFLAEDTEAEALLLAGARIAKEAAEPFGAFVFGDMGPVTGGEEVCFSVYKRQTELFLGAGIDCFLIETLPSLAGVEQFAAWLKQTHPDTFLLVSFAAGPDGATLDGLSGRALFLSARDCPHIDACGFNCYSGPGHMLRLLRGMPPGEVLTSAMPNAGYPTTLGRRTVYGGSPAYFSGMQVQLYQCGVRILGGCCGTTPAHIAALSEELKKLPLPGDVFALKTPPSAAHAVRPNPLREKLFSGAKCIFAEYDPPREDDLTAYMEGVKELGEAGADAITIADCPVGVPRVDSTLLACKIRRELHMEAVPHMACRDRNLNAIKALLLGLSAEDLHTVLLVTGDPIPVELRDKVKGVFNCHSRRLASFVRSLGEEGVHTPFLMLGALNVNAPNFASELKLAVEKEENGIEGFLTQPVLSPEAEENLRRARETLHGKLLAGIYPPVSYRNACFLNNEIGGIRVSPEIMESYRDLDREQAQRRAEELSVTIARAVAPYSDGWYLMTPFARTALIARIIDRIKKEIL